MLSTLLSTTLLVSLIPATLGSYIYTPVDVVQCASHDLTWKGKAPFTVSVWPGCDSDAETDDALSTYSTNSTKAVWTVNVKSGDSIMLSVIDAHGDGAYTDDVTVKGSKDTSCLGKAASFVVPESQKPQTTSTSASVAAPTTQVPPTTQAPSTTAPANVGDVPAGPSDSPVPSLPVGGALSGAMTSYSARAEMVAVAVVASLFVGIIY